jgi:hypothetical protein
METLCFLDQQQLSANEHFDPQQMRTIFVNDRVIIFVIEGFSISTELFREAHMK